jgi:hypothetical protein
MTRFIPRAQRAMLTARLVGGLQVALIVAGCGSSMTVHTDYDRTANFAAFKTYTWREGTKLPNPLMEQRVIDAVDAQLKAKGLTRVDTGGDVSVTYHAGRDGIDGRPDVFHRELLRVLGRLHVHRVHHGSPGDDRNVDRRHGRHEIEQDALERQRHRYRDR